MRSFIVLYMFTNNTQENKSVEPDDTAAHAHGSLDDTNHVHTQPNKSEAKVKI